MALPELVAVRCKKLLDAFCERRVPLHARHQVRLIHKTRGNVVTLLETRADWRDADAPWLEHPVARFSYAPGTGKWTLRSVDHHSRSHTYRGAPATKDFERLLDEVDRDPTHVFWG